MAADAASGAGAAASAPCKIPTKVAVRQKVEAAYKNRSLFGRLMMFDDATSWQSHIYDIEDSETYEVLYVINKFDDNDWRITAVAKREGSRVCRLALPQAWRGLRDTELEKVSGVKDVTFCHASGFMGGSKTLEGVRTMSALALKGSRTLRLIIPCVGSGPPLAEESFTIPDSLIDQAELDEFVGKCKSTWGPLPPAEFAKIVSSILP